ncbi:MAG: Gfo/Idh/MocA family oxidoreductase [Acidimicrobiia bacterium]|nr:Gfo/Idh/MocA family oxidoreductase [Acidimicrobiia bacterium]
MTVGIGIVGTGRWAGAHARAAARSDTVRLVHCAARSQDRRAAFAAEFGIDRHSPDIATLLADPEVQAVVVSTPNDLHVEMALTTLAAGKPVLVDKPISVDLTTGLELARAVERFGIGLGVAHHPRRLAGHRAAADWLSHNDSTIRLAYANFSNARGAAMKPDAWHRSAKGSEAGVLIQVGIHPVDTLLSLVGPAVGLNARFSYGVVGPDIPDTAVVTMTHASGATSVVGTNWSTPSNYTLDLLTTKGNLLFTANHAWWTKPDFDHHSELLLDVDGADPEPLALDAGDPLRDQLDELGATALGTGEMTVDVWDGLRAMGVVLGAVESARRQGAYLSLETAFGEAGATDAELAILLG